MNTVSSDPLKLKPVVSPIEVTDRLERPLRDLRISVLDRCNLRCTYCMPADSLQGQGIFLPREDLLSDDELVELVKVFIQLGVHKVRLTGGEPLLRPNLSSLVERLANLDGIDDLALTTNAILLPRHASDLKHAGLGRITVSLDSLDPDVFSTMSGGHGSVKDVLAGISAAEQAGFESIKINTVVQRGVNEHTVESLLSHFKGSGHVVRLIEFMDVGNLNHWSESQVVPSAELVSLIQKRWPLKMLAPSKVGETARRYAYADGSGEIGFISSISQPFCGNCNRARVTADGTFYSCLFAARGTALRPLLRQNMSTGVLLDYLHKVWLNRQDRYSEQRNAGNSEEPRVEMFRMGG